MVVFEGEVNLALEGSAFNHMLEIQKRLPFVFSICEVVVALRQKHKIPCTSHLVVSLRLLHQVLKLNVLPHLQNLSCTHFFSLPTYETHVCPLFLKLYILQLIFLVLNLVLKLHYLLFYFLLVHFC